MREAVPICRCDLGADSIRNGYRRFPVSLVCIEIENASTSLEEGVVMPLEIVKPCVFSTAAFLPFLPLAKA